MASAWRVRLVAFLGCAVLCAAFASAAWADGPHMTISDMVKHEGKSDDGDQSVEEFSLYFGKVYAGRKVEGRIPFESTGSETLEISDIKFSCIGVMTVWLEKEEAGDRKLEEARYAPGERGWIGFSINTLKSSACFKRKIFFLTNDADAPLKLLELTCGVSDAFAFWPSEINVVGSADEAGRKHSLHVLNTLSREPVEYTVKVPEALQDAVEIVPVQSTPGLNTFEISWDASAIDLIEQERDAFVLLEPHNAFVDEHLKDMFILAVPLVNEVEADSLSVNPEFLDIVLASEKDYENAYPVVINSNQEDFEVQSVEYNARAFDAAWFQESPRFFHILLRPKPDKKLTGLMSRREVLIVHLVEGDPLNIPVLLGRGY